MRFDDTLETVLAADVSTPFGQASMWRQLVDIAGRGRAGDLPAVMASLEALKPDIPKQVRMASARMLEFADPPAPLVEMFALDWLEVGLPVLRGARLDDAAWTELLPRLSPAARSVLRNRRDLGATVMRALASFGSVDFVLGDDRSADEKRAPIEVARGDEMALPVEPVPQTPPTMIASEFQPVGAVALGLPLVAEAVRRASIDDDAAEPENVEGDGPFRIADVVARIDAYQRSQPDIAALAPIATPRLDEFRFETDAQGCIRAVDGVARGAIVGTALNDTAAVGGAGFDASAAGAFRHRQSFRDARLMIAGSGDAGGLWLVSAVAAFDQASGRFTGYRGVGKRPRVDQRIAPVPRAHSAMTDSLRELVHELRTPAGAITGFAELIEQQLLGPVPEVYRGRAMAIRTQSRELLAIIDDLDLAARIEADTLDLRPARVPIGVLLTRLTEELAPLADMRGSAIVAPDGDEAVQGDPRAVERVVSRLLTTVVSASGEGERIAVLVARDGDKMVRIAIDRPAGFDPTGDVDDSGDLGGTFGVSFGLRLVGNLARELSGALVIGRDRLTLRLPNADGPEMEQAARN